MTEETDAGYFECAYRVFTCSTLRSDILQAVSGGHFAAPLVPHGAAAQPAVPQPRPAGPAQRCAPCSCILSTLSWPRSFTLQPVAPQPRPTGPSNLPAGAALATTVQVCRSPRSKCTLWMSAEHQPTLSCSCPQKRIQCPQSEAAIRDIIHIAAGARVTSTRSTRFVTVSRVLQLISISAVLFALFVCRLSLPP